MTVASSAGPYPVRVMRGWGGLGDALSDRPRPVLVTDTNVAPLWARVVAAELDDPPLIVLPAGEARKDLHTWRLCVDRLLEVGVDRGTPVLALGGGVVGDLVGFAAACALRGLPLVQLPTTLLAMVDSSVGGKVGVNRPRGKNLVGAFHPPVLVWAALDALSTLPLRDLRSGLAEVVKVGLVCDAELLDLVEARAEALVGGRDLEDVVVRAVRAKARVVEADEREQGLRILLNAGHTVGHALETAAGHGVLRHGEAVAIGLLAELRWAVGAGICRDPELPGRLERLLLRLGLPIRAEPVDRATALAAMRLDKKGRGDKIQIAFPLRAGASTVFELSRSDAQALLAPDLTEEPRG